MRGEISAMLGGRERKLRLTLGALAEIETALGDGDIMALIARLEAGEIRARDCIIILRAGLAAAGETASDVEAFGP